MRGKPGPCPHYSHPSPSPAQVQRILRLKRQDFPITEIAQSTGFSTTSIDRVLKQHPAQTKPIAKDSINHLPAVRELRARIAAGALHKKSLSQLVKEVFEIPTS